MSRSVITWLIILILLCAALIWIGCGGSSGTDDIRNSSTPANRIIVMWQGVQNDTMNCSWINIFSGSERAKLAFPFNSYGSNNRCLFEFFAQHPDAHLRIYLSQGVCKRKGNCSDRETAGIDDIRLNLHSAQLLLQACAGCTVDWVLELEDNYRHDEACNLAAQLREDLAGEKLWRNPNRTVDHMPGSDCFDGVELHNDDYVDLQHYNEARAWSNDGADLLVGTSQWAGDVVGRDDVRRIRGELGRGVDIILWSAAGNCITGDTVTQPYPHDRVCITDTLKISEINHFLLELQGEYVGEN